MNQSGNSGAESYRHPSAARPKRRWSLLQRILVRLGLLTGAALFAIALCELALWVVAPIPWHEWAIWVPEGHITGRYMPNQEIKTASGHVFRVNKHGFRGPDYTFEKASGTLRIEIFGGSAALCYKSAGRQKSWPGALELKLQERLNMPVEVINLALAGFTSFKSKINYLCFGRAFNPDAIIVYHTWNDISRFRELETVPYIPQGMPKNWPLWARFARATQLGRRVRMAEFIFQGRRYDIIARPMEGTGEGFDRPITPRAWDWVRQNYEDITRFANADGVLPILVTQAGLASRDNIDDPEVAHHMGAMSRGVTLPLAVDTWLRINEIIETVAREQNALFVDGYNTVPHDLKHIRDNVHLFDEGSEVLAEEIARVLLDDERFLALVARVRAEVGPRP
jgi:hypothetical protein